MNSITKTFSLLCLGALAAAITACASNSASQCEATGVLCPAGTHCAAAQPICISDTIRCGDAHVDADEECDDGNNIDGDGCSHLCTIEICGNHRIDPHEQCDDGNTDDGDGCSHNCTVEICGNGIKDLGEVCDDGNTKDGDGCSADCKSTEICGNGIVDKAVGEICDDGNTADGDGCSADCRSGEGCGNGILDTALGEECDDGNKDNNDDCRNDCVVNRCGDGIVNLHGGGIGHTEHVEQCDDATPAAKDSRDVTPTETATCNIDCTIPKCGDGKVNHSFHPIDPITNQPSPTGEQCDNVDGTGKSLNSNDADCTATCQINVCGDGLPDTKGPKHIEACDDGNTNDADGCSNACTLPNCGNGIVDEGEECDDGNKDDNDDCRNDCVVNRCGDGVLNTDGTHKEACESATVQLPGSRALTSTESQTCNNDCTVPKCGDGKVNHSFHPINPDTNQPTVTGEQCDNVDGTGKSLNSDDSDCTAACQINVCGDGLPDTKGPKHIEACDDGDKNDANGCSNACTLPHCGNGIVDEGEECDDGNADNNDDCRNDCVVNRCGDGVLDLHGTHTEACESATVQPSGSHALTSPESQTCNNDCTVPKCGDGKVNHSFHPINPDTNQPTVTGEQCDNVDGTGKSLNSDDADCTAACQINVCGDGLKDTKGPNHIEPCDDGNINDGDGCSSACTLPSCGNGIVDKGEECDDANSTNGDACENNCTLPRCGNGIKDGGEECDDGNPSNADDCTNACKFARCGDGFLRTAMTPPPTGTPTVAEQCDTAITPTSPADCPYDPVQQACVLCDQNCQTFSVTAPFCGDGHIDMPFETCDSGNPTCGACTSDCQTVTSQHASGLIFAAAGKDLHANDTFTLSDGFTTPVTFEFTQSTVNGAGNVPIIFDPGDPTDPTKPGDSNSDMAAKIKDAITGARVGGLKISAGRLGGLVQLTNNRASSLGNGPPDNPARIDPHVQTPNFAVVDMAGGLGGNCGTNTPCAIDADCASGSCSTTAPHVCQ